ncbi:MAG: hypothetical protein JWP82_666 [Humibacillus sp.]|nr:hypothetical protein [Humibacillus sp.]
MHLVCITGPSAVGKMTVGRAVCERTGYRLFHNHLTIEPLLAVFEHGTPSFNRLNTLFRAEVIAEAVAADLPGLVFTYAMDFDSQDDLGHLLRLIAPVLDAGIRVDAVELYAAQDVRLAREGRADRVAHKPSKAAVELARSRVVDTESWARFNTVPGAAPEEGGWPWPWMPHLGIVNEGQDPEAVADRIVDALRLPRVG